MHTRPSKQASPGAHEPPAQAQSSSPAVHWVLVVVQTFREQWRLESAQVPEGMGVFEAGALAALDAKFPEDLPLAAKPWLARLAVPATPNRQARR